MKSKGKKICKVALAVAACAVASVSLTACGLFGGEGGGDGEKFSVRFDAGWGTIYGDRIYDTEVTSGAHVAEPSEKPICDGYVFTGWNLTGNAQDEMWKFDADTVTEHITLYAVWSRAYTVTFFAEGGTFGNGTDTYELTVAENGKIAPPTVTPPDDYRELAGWTFNGYEWNIDADGVTRDMTLRAKWELKASIAAALEPFDYYPHGDAFAISGIKDKSTTSVTVPNVVDHIAPEAFANCTSLVSVEIPASVIEIGRSAFAGCALLRDVTLAEGLTAIGAAAFAQCVSLVNISLPNTVSAIYSSAFSGCSSLESITLPAKVTRIESYTFNDCAALESVEIKGEVTTIGTSAFSGCASLENFDIPSNLASLGSNAFNGCASLATVTVPASCADVDWWMFKDCTGLVSATLNCPIVDTGMFYGCTSLADVTFGATVTEIGSSAFKNCTSLVEIEIPDGVTTVEGWVFEGCTALKSATLGSGVTVIESSLFANCSSLRGVEFGDITAIRNGAFEGCVSLLSFTIPASVRTVGSDAFAGCARLVEVYNLSSAQLTGVGFIPYITKHASASEASIIDGTSTYVFCTRNEGGDTVNYLLDYTGDAVNITLPAYYMGESYAVFDYALAINDRLKNITFSAGVAEIGKNVLFGSPAVETLEVQSGNAKYTSKNNCVIETSERKFVLGCKSSVIPADGTVTKIGGDVFCQNAAIENPAFVIPSAVTVVERGAFAGCDGIVRTADNGVKYVDKWAVEIACGDDVDSINVTLDANTVGISNGAFSSNSDYAVKRKIVSFTANASLEYVGEDAFYGCNNLKTVTLNYGLLAIGGSAFGSCDKLEEIAIPNSVARIGSAAFMSCDALAYVRLSSGISVVEYQMFDGCAALATVVIPHSVTRIEHDAFAHCAANLTVYYGGDASGWSGVRKDSGNSLISGGSAKIVYFSETSAPDCWHYGANGKPELWA